jgi:hypothetical protein
MSGIETFPDNHKEAAHSRVAVGYGSCDDPLDVDPLSYKFPGKLGLCRYYGPGSGMMESTTSDMRRE